MSVPTRIDLSDGSGYLDLPETEEGYSSVITRRACDGTAVWKALPPEGESDAWVSVSIAGHCVRASSWSGWQLTYDLSSGVEIERLFTK